LGETNVGTNASLLETVHQFCLEQEKIMISLSDRQNQRNLDPSQGEENGTETHRQQEQHQESEGGQNSNKEESDNGLSKKRLK